MKKVAIIGAGQVGATAALAISQKEIADVVLIDIMDGVPQGKSLDMLQAGPLQACDSNLCGSNSCKDVAGADIVVITAGLARKPGMTREDLLQKNAEIVKGVAKDIKECAPDAIVIIVTNPLDVMSYLTLKTTGFDPKKVMGMAGVLDSTRFRTFIAEELGVSKRDVDAMVLGSHGDSMVPVIECTTVAGIPLAQLMDKKKIDELAERTKNGGAEIVSYLKTGSAYYAPGYSVAEMVEAIIKDSKRVLPISVYLNGEYGYDDIYLGLPVILGKDGVEKIIEIKLSDETKQQLDNSAEATKKNIANLKELVKIE
ncbi:MAG: malate dehydrogenase [Nanoarchaeota archaeon]